MPEAHRAVTLVTLSLLLLAGANRTVSAPPAVRPTIEPTLALVVDLRLAGVERSAGLARGRLEVDLQAQGPIDHVELSLTHPAALRVSDAAALPSVFGMAEGERRLVVLPFEGPGGDDVSIRLQGSFRTADGRTFRLGQGVTLEAPRPMAGGRSRLDAWEVMAVPLEDLRR